jgi:PAS domain S-box-containing protein
MSRQDTDSGSRLLIPRLVACALLLLFLVIFSMMVFIINRQYSDLKKQASASETTVTSLLSEFVLDHEKAAIALLQSYAGSPLLIDAVKRKDVAKTRSHLEGMKKINEELDLTFITDKRGILWVNYPVFPEAVGRDLSYRDWYKGVSSGWEPYISRVFKLIVADQPLAVAVCVPIFDREGSVIGILASSQRVSFLAETIRRVPLQSYTKVTLLDRAGNIIYSNRLRYAAEITTYPFLPAVKEALRAGKSRIEIKESQSWGSTVSATVRFIAPIEWTVVAEHTSKDVLRAGYSQFATTAAMSLLFFTVISLLLLYARKQALLADTERLLIMERKISEEERQRQMQEKLSYSEMRYLSLHESMIDGFVVTGMDGYIRECNQAYQHMLGYGPDEIMSLTYNDITPAKWHDFEKTIVEEQVIPRGHSEIYEKEYVRKDGAVFPVELRTYLVKDDKGSPSGMRAVVRDITRRKQAEEALRESEARFRRVSAITSDIAYSCSTNEDSRFLIKWMTGATDRIAGYSSEEIKAQGCWRFLVVEEDISLFEENVIGLAPGSQGSCELRIRHKNGGIVWIASFSECVSEPQTPGRLLLYGGLTDITERKEAEENIRASLREKEVLLKEIHHRVKNNLQIVSSLLFMQSTRTKHPEAVSVLRESRNRIRSMALIHERLYQSPNLASVDMGKYTRKLVSDLQHSHITEDSSVRLTLNIEYISLGITEAIPCGLIINELVSNALKHAFPKGRGFHGVACGNLSSEHGEREGEAHTALPGEGATRVPVVAGEITIQLLKEGASHITLTVSDNGTGFPESLDFRKSPSLGLTLISSLVEQLHGTIELDRRGGTAFTITFKVSG